jgi:hypothetical protein
MSTLQAQYATDFKRYKQVTYQTFGSVKLRKITSKPLPMGIQLFFILALSLAVASCGSAMSQVAALQRHCLYVAPEPSREMAHGTVVLQATNITLLNLWTGEKFDLVPDARLYSDSGKGIIPFAMIISPDARWLLYSEAQFENTKVLEEKFLIVDARGHIQHSAIAPLQSIKKAINWGDQNKIVFEEESPGQFARLNLLTDQWDRMSIDLLPDAIEDINNYSFPPIISYSIDLTQSLYVSSMRSRAILWDIKSQKRLWEWKGETLNGYDWLTNGMGLIVAYQDFNSDTSRVTLVGRDGHVSELLNLKNLSPQAIISGIAMSPDENYFAAWVSSQEYSETHLMVANLRLQQIVDYCITPSNFYDMLWSPDSKYLLVSAPSVSGNRDSILIDIEHFYAARIASNTSPVGWLYTENKPRK